MSILTRAAAPFLNWFSSTGPPQRNPGDFWGNGGGYSDTGMIVSHESAMTVSAVYAAVSLISETIASLPVNVLANYGANRFPRPRPAWMTQPNSEWDWPTYCAATVVSLLLGGDAISVIVRDRAGLAGELWLLDPRTVTVDRDPQTRNLQYWCAGASRPLNPADVLHVRGLTLPGYLRGVSPVEYARQTIGLALGDEKFAAKMLANGATPAVVVTTPKNVTDQQAEAFAGRIDRLHAGLDNVGKTAVFGGGAEIKTLTMTNEQMQFIEARRFQVNEVARWFRVPPHMIGEVSGSTSWGTGIEQQNIMFLQHTLTPWLVRLESALLPLISEWSRLGPVRDSGDWYARFNVNGLLRADSAGRAALYDSMVRNAAFSPNDVLAKEDMNPFTGGDSHYLQAGYAPIGPDGQLILPAAATIPTG
jgi:HK97 family phage portal protein